MSEDFENEKIRQFNDQIGATATIKRTGHKGEVATKINRLLREIGEQANPSPPTKDFGGLTYIGSSATHIYKSEVLQQLFFVAQTDTLQDCPEVIASKAFEDLKGASQEFFGKGRQTRRSGF